MYFMAVNQWIVVSKLTGVANSCDKSRVVLAGVA